MTVKGTPDFRYLYNKILGHWYYFAISFAVCFAVVYVLITTSEKRYEVNASVLVADVSTGPKASSEILDALDIKDKAIKLEDIIGLLSSTSMVKNAIIQLDRRISHFEVPNHWLNAAFPMFSKRSDGNFPYIITINENKGQLATTPIHIKNTTGKKFLLSYEVEDGYLFDYNLNQSTEAVKDTTIEAEFEFGKPFENEHLSLTISHNPEYQGPAANGYFFVLNNINNLSATYQSKLEVEPLSRDSRILILKSEGPIPAQEMNFLNKLIEVYIAYDLARKNQTGNNTIQFIDSQLSEISDSLQRAERNLEYYRSANRIVDINYVSGNIMQKLDDLETQRADLTMSLNTYESLLSYLNQESSEYSQSFSPSLPGIQSNAVLTNLLVEFNDLNRERAGMSATARAGNPVLESLDEKIKNTRRALIDNINSLVKNTRDQISYTDQRIGSLEASIIRLPQNERQLVGLERKFEFNDKTYDLLLEKRTEAVIEAATNTSDIEVIDQAKLSSNAPVAPNKKFYVMLALLPAILIPGGVLYLKEMVNDKIHSSKEVKELTKIPVIGEIIYQNNKKTELPALEQPISQISDSFRFISVNLQFYSKSRELGKVALVTSSTSGEGKSFITSNLAVVLAQSNKKVLIIDADMRLSRISDNFNIQNTEKGLSNYLAGNLELDEIIVDTPIDNLDAVIAGPPPPNPVDLISKPSMVKLIEEVRKKYDYVLIDTPPVGIVSEFLILSRYSDSDIFVIRQERTRKSDIERINEIAERKNLYDIGLVYNCARIESTTYYNRRYRSHYHKKTANFNGVNGKEKRKSKKQTEKI